MLPPDDSPPARRPWKFPNPLSEHIRVPMTTGMRADIERAAAADNLSLSHVVRECVELGLPRYRDRQRKRRKRSAAAPRT